MDAPTNLYLLLDTGSNESKQQDLMIARLGKGSKNFIIKPWQHKTVYIKVVSSKDDRIAIHLNFQTVF